MSNTTFNELYKKFSTTRNLTIIVIVSVLALGFSGWWWWKKVYTNPQRVFWAMISNSLSSSGVTKHTIQTNSQGSLDQITQVQLGSQDITRIMTTLQQTGVSGTNTAKSESIGTPDTDYIRYNSIETKQTNAQGKPLNFSKVLGVWSKSDPVLGGQSASPQFFQEGILEFIPFGPLKPAQRQALIQLMRDKKVYDVSYATAMHKTKNGRPVIVYKVSLNAGTDIEMLQQFVSDLGLGKLPVLDPTNYEGAAPLSLEVTVDVISRQLLTIRNLESDSSETYLAQGLRQPVTLPTNTIPVSELQNRLQNIQ